jgi:putative acetyltransferase
MQIRIDDLNGPEIAALLNEHLADMRAASPPESVHALDLDKLRQPEITFWTMWHEGQLAGCGALKQLDGELGEIKSMRVAMPFRRQGVAAKILQHIIDEARSRQYRQLMLETGSTDNFVPAHKLYESFGFTRCPRFADYDDDPFSVFMQLELNHA